MLTPEMAEAQLRFNRWNEFEENWKNENPSENPSDINDVIKEYDPFAGDDPVDLTDDDLPF